MLAALNSSQTRHTTGPDPRRSHSKGYIPTLDGWRAIAIIWVLFAHSQVWSLGRFSIRPVVETGNRGVQLFFALSGFLICSRLLREEVASKSISLKSFYIRRLFRIQPAALTYLLVLVLLGAIGIIKLYLPGVIGAALMIRNFWPSTPAEGAWYTAHFWSLAVEEHFYLLLPGFLVLCRKRRLMILGLAVVAFEFWRQVVFNNPPLQRVGMLVDLRTDMVIGEILLGSVTAVALAEYPSFQTYVKRWLHPWLALLYTTAVFTYLSFHESRFNHAILITVFPVLIIATVFHAGTWVSRFLELAAVRFVGRISYSLYLWQMLFLDPFVTPARGTFRANNTLCWCAAIACSIASYYLVEKPLISVGHRLAARSQQSQMVNFKPVQGANVS